MLLLVDSEILEAVGWKWVGFFEHHGCPALIAAVEDFVRWRGGSPVPGLARVAYSGELVARLPERFVPLGRDSWHQTSPTTSVPHALDYALELIDAARAIEPALEEQQPAGSKGSFEERARENASLSDAERDAHARSSLATFWHAALYGAKPTPVLQLRMQEVSDYTRATDALQRGDCVPIEIGDAGTALVWSAVNVSDEGRVDVAIDAEAGEVVLATIACDDEASLGEARAFVTSAAAVVGDGCGSLDLSSGALVVATATLIKASIEKASIEKASIETAADVDAVQIEDVMGKDGLLVRARPGRYTAHRITREDAAWSVEACRLVASM